jgi:P27 family predicted phage terminase small subunit
MNSSPCVAYRGQKNANHRMITKNTPHITAVDGGEDCDVPNYLTDDIAIDEWKRIAPRLAAAGRLNAPCRALLVGYCSAVAKAIRAEETVLREGRYYETETSRGSLMRRRHPAAQDADHAWGAIRRFAKQLGLVAPDLLHGGGLNQRRALLK